MMRAKIPTTARIPFTASWAISTHRNSRASSLAVSFSFLVLIFGSLGIGGWVGAGGVADTGLCGGSFHSRSVRGVLLSFSFVMVLAYCRVKLSEWSNGNPSSALERGPLYPLHHKQA